MPEWTKTRTDLMSSGDPRLDRRYVYAKAAFDEGDMAGCIELLAQTLDEAPHWAAAWFLIAHAHEKSGDVIRAITAYQHTAECDAEGLLGAGLDLARLGVTQAANAGSSGYVAALFDEYAPRFDRHLRRDLGYTGPEILFSAVGRACTRMPRHLTFDSMVDIGCGTGLAAEVFQPRVRRMTGVDLSARMIARARQKRLYERLDVSELTLFLSELAPFSAELVLAADVFVYMGDLAPAITRAAAVLERAGLIAFTVQTLPETMMAGEDIKVGHDKRFVHSASYVRRVLDEAGLQVELIDEASTRFDEGVPVPGLVAVASKR
jgi:predicted TPR repeat methyltransferase